MYYTKTLEIHHNWNWLTRWQAGPNSVGIAVRTGQNVISGGDWKCKTGQCRTGNWRTKTAPVTMSGHSRHCLLAGASTRVASEVRVSEGPGPRLLEERLELHNPSPPSPNLLFTFSIFSLPICLYYIISCTLPPHASPSTLPLPIHTYTTPFFCPFPGLTPESSWGHGERWKLLQRTQNGMGHFEKCFWW